MFASRRPAFLYPDIPQVQQAMGTPPRLRKVVDATENGSDGICSNTAPDVTEKEEVSTWQQRLQQD